MQKVLIIEDEKEMATGLKDILEFEGYEVATAETGKEGLQAVGRKVPDCIILDLMLPDISGYEVCEQLRQKLKTPILMLTARAQDHDKIRGFKVGADDYLTKPFSVGELLARVMALLRRHTHYSQDLDQVRVGHNLVDVKHFTVKRGKNEYSLSHYGTDKYPTNRTVDNFIVKLRKKLEEDYKNPKHILTIYGVGYKLSP
jgi:DNA-binding response OmpR family regulator